MKLHPTTLILAAVAGLVAVGCGGEEPATNTEVNTPAENTENTPAPTPEPEGPKADMEAAKTRFVACAACHGNAGEGDGAAAAALDPKPRSFKDAEWQASVTDEHLIKVIVEGGPAVGLSPLMAPNGDLTDKPEVVAGLVQMIRDMGK